MRIIVTGSSGTIATRFIERVMNKHEITPIDVRDNPFIEEKIHERFKRNTIKHDLLEPLDDLYLDADMVIHLAARTRVYHSVLAPWFGLENVAMTYNILEYCRKRDIDRIIFGSSREIYGNKPPTEKREEMVSLDCIDSPYAASKVSCEAFIVSYAKCYGIKYIILRFSNVYGMYDLSDRVIPNWIKKAFRNEDLIVYGNKILDFTYIDDAVQGLINAVEYFDKAYNDTYNIATGRGTRLRRVADLIVKYTSSKSRIIMKESRKGEVLKYIANIDKARKKLKYEPRVFIEEGIKRAVEWYKKYFNKYLL